MAKVNLVDKRAKLSLWDAVKFQLITHCYLNRITMSDSELNCLTLLGIQGECELTDFCTLAAGENIFKTTQTVRNCLAKMETEGFIRKEGRSKKKIMINPDLKLQAQGNILLDFKFVYAEPKES
jgi:hypothetical protein